jgi:UDP-2,4-diacetamido-2,4,6-trideoxy-beta-L-altropyranose hydrolase
VPLKVAFRVDASARIGSGHFMRSLALADALRERGGRAYFLCRCLPAALAESLAAGGHDLVQLESPNTKAKSPANSIYAEWLGVEQEEDAEQTAAALGGRNCTWLVVDHYALDYLWERKMRAAGARILCVDDLANRDHDCDLLVDHGFYENPEARYSGRVPGACRTLLGPRYALLRKEFHEARSRAHPRDGVVRRILVSFGGSDAANATGAAVQALEALSLRDVRVDVVIGSEHPQRSAIDVACKRCGFSIHVQSTRMAELMAAADLAIGAGGGSTWERCCVGLPCLTMSLAKNQEELVRDSARAGLLYAPSVAFSDPVGLARHLHALLENSPLLTSLSLRCLKLVDGRGTQRVLRAMGVMNVAVRPAILADAGPLFEWRNHASIREVSRTANALDWSGHQSWVASVLADSDRVLLIGEVAALPVGVVRFDVSNDTAEVSIYMVPGQEGRGYGTELLMVAEGWFSRHRPEVHILEAEILGGNDAARNLFRRACYDVSRARFVKRIG